MICTPIGAVFLLAMLTLLWQLFGLAILTLEQRVLSPALVIAALLMGPMILPLRMLYRVLRP